jgi:putative transcriptional regulator
LQFARILWRRRHQRRLAEILFAGSYEATTDDRFDYGEIRQIASNPDAAPDMAPEIDVRAIRRAAGMTQAQFAAAYEFSVRTVQEWERGAKRPSGPARTLLRAIKGDPEEVRRA